MNPGKKNRPPSSRVEAEERKPSGKKKPPPTKREISRTKSLAVISAGPSPETKARQMTISNPRQRSAPGRRKRVTPSKTPEELLLEEDTKQAQLLESLGADGLQQLDRRRLREHMTGARPFTPGLEAVVTRALRRKVITPSGGQNPSKVSRKHISFSIDIGVVEEEVTQS